MSWPPGASTCFGWLNEDGDIVNDFFLSLCAETKKNIVNDDGDGDDDDFGDVLHVVCHPESPHALDESGCWTSSFLEEVDLINLITAKQIVFITIVIVRIALNFLTMITVTILFHFRHLYKLYVLCILVPTSIWDSLFCSCAFKAKPDPRIPKIDFNFGN